MTDVYRALGDQTRREILQLLKEGNKTQKEIVESFAISQPAIKKHLTVLLEEKMITSYVHGRFRVYSLNTELLHEAYQEMLQYIGDLLDDQLVSLKKYVEEGDIRDD
ncbi:metalloregulator ArsR/SmtB family transcription factor [Ornithinibacillus halotolerans]|uniref:HTH arsR-type domain-containing protein n=1 Tax=Ornithinibacillus halotolerans TaxID=1274357 RepID=A0A916S7S5_9BACI|nr:metalloregulator ArsR/SmtB family transcription factor [Ornithinibacillus halotolerans]GGA85168.1 hypothetical protein GCM10008025_30260 [Ornithinibacillus halotolerans]